MSLKSRLKKLKSRKVMVAIPNMGFITDNGPDNTTSAIKSLIGLIQRLERTENDYEVELIPRWIVHEARNELVRRANEKKCTHILFIDSDMVYDDDIVDKLLTGHEIVAAKCRLRIYPFSYAMYKKSEVKPGFYDDYTPEQKNGILKIDAVGFGAVMIDMKVFNKVKEKWFEFTQLGEDLNFCRKAQEAGFDIRVNMDCEVGHITDVVVRDKNLGLQ